MNNRLEKILRTTTAGVIVFSTVVWPRDEETHTHPEEYNCVNDYSDRGYTAVVSGELLRNEYPEYIKDIGPSPYNPKEKLIAITGPLDDI